MADNVIVKPGVSGQSVKFNAKEVDCETLANEVALLSLGDWEGLKVKVNCGQYSKQIKEFENDWVDYLPRTDKINNRKALSLLNLPGKTHQDNPSLAQACVEADRYVNEAEFNVPTKVYNKLECLHPLLNIFPTLGRTFLVKCGEGAYFHPHRDQQVFDLANVQNMRLPSKSNDHLFGMGIVTDSWLPQQGLCMA